ncbi:MAG TPA: hypothetical protein VFO48_02480, partial [Vicinamibacterales bacterium]|nr:hypothetical protein [Vicinamibacterales bacterium]
QHDQVAVHSTPNPRELPRDRRENPGEEIWGRGLDPPGTVNSKNVIDHHNYAPDAFYSKGWAVFRVP